MNTIAAPKIQLNVALNQKLWADRSNIKPRRPSSAFYDLMSCGPAGMAARAFSTVLCDPQFIRCLSQYCAGQRSCQVGPWLESIGLVLVVREVLGHPLGDIPLAGQPTVGRGLEGAGWWRSQTRQ